MSFVYCTVRCQVIGLLETYNLVITYKNIQKFKNLISIKNAKIPVPQALP